MDVRSSKSLHLNVLKTLDFRFFVSGSRLSGIFCPVRRQSVGQLTKAILGALPSSNYDSLWGHSVPRRHFSWQRLNFRLSFKRSQQSACRGLGWRPLALQCPNMK